MLSRNTAGFTLIEVVIATFIVGIALIALMGTVQVTSRQAIQLEEAFIANLIANNLLAETQLQKEWPEIGEQNESIEMSNRDWFYEIKVEATDVETLRRVEVSVGLDDDQNRVSGMLVGFVSSSSQIGQRPVDWLKYNNVTSTEGEITGARQ